MPLKQIIINNFVGGIAWALGATIGLSLVLAVVGGILKNFNFIPIFGTFISQLVDFVMKNNSSLHH